MKGCYKMAEHGEIEFRYNKWGIFEVYKDGDYDGVIATWPNPNKELGEALLEEIDRVYELREKGIKPEPNDWSEFYGNK